MDGKLTIQIFNIKKMINEKLIDINNATYGETINMVSPVTLYFSTSGYIPTRKLWKIVYNFGDGNQKTQMVQNFTTVENLTALPYQDEPGDPRNYIVNNRYYFEDDINKTYNISIEFYRMGIELPQILNFNLNLRLPVYNSDDVHIKNFKLVGTRMFGLDNRMIYVFESQKQNYLIPILLDFNKDLSNN